MRFKNWKTVPVGRYLVDVPTDAKLTFYAFIESHELKILEGSVEDARHMVQNRIDELKGTQHELKGNMFIRSVVLDNNAILIQSYELESDTELIWIDIYYVARLKERDIIYQYSNTISDPNIDSPQLKKYLDFASSLRPLEDGVIPDHPALCMGNIMLPGSDSFFKENITVQINFPDIKEFSMSFGTNSAILNYKNILDFSDPVGNEYYQIQNYKNGKTLRKGDHSVGGKFAQEICVAGDDEKFHFRKYAFVWGAVPDKPPFGKPLNKLTPYLKANLRYRGDPYTDTRPIRPFPSDDAALAVWDRFINSVRVRPVVEQGK